MAHASFGCVVARGATLGGPPLQRRGSRSRGPRWRSQPIEFGSNRRVQWFRVPEEGNKMADGMNNSDGERFPRLPRTFKMRRREYLLSEAPQYLRDAYNAQSSVPIEEMLSGGMTLNGVRYRIYLDAAAREKAKRNGIDEHDKLSMENPSDPVDPRNPPADERPA